MTAVTLPKGFRTAATAAGIKAAGRSLDLGLLVADHAAPAAALFTRNAMLGAHIPVCRDHLARSGGAVRAVIVNSGCANCSTGQRGLDDARRTAAAVARALDCPAEHVLPISTGAIGSHLPIERIEGAVPELVAALGTDSIAAFARAMMTTDTHPKLASALATGARVTGIAKGAGMIHPDMATMLGFVLTDAVLGDLGDPRTLADQSFHRVTIDGDTSPNDTVLLWGTGGAGASDPSARRAAAIDVAKDLAKQIAGDGEGASRLVTIAVHGAPSEAEAVHVGRVIGTSPLTKTAIAGRDPNWGRIVAAAGRAGVPFDPDRARVWIGATTVFDAGAPRPEREIAAARYLRDEREVELGIDLAAGDAKAEVWTCDLTAEYVRINADYRT